LEKKIKMRFVLTATITASLLVLLLALALNIFNWHQTRTGIKNDMKLALSDDKDPPPLPANKQGGLFNEKLHRVGIVVIDNGKMRRNDMGLTLESALVQAEKALSEEKTFGRIGTVFYLVTDEGEKIAFADASAEISGCITLIWISIMVSAGFCIVLYGIAVLVSPKVVAPLVENYRMQQRFISDAGHELKTPVAIIQANVEALELIHGANKWTGNIAQQSQRLIKLTKELMYLVNMDEKPSQQDLIPIDISTLAVEAVDGFSELAKSKNKSISCDVSENTVIMAVESDCQKLISILLDNAIKHSPDGAGVAAEVKKSEKKCILRVSNPSEPVDERSLKLLFDRFYKIDASRGEKTGYGIGLAIAKRITENYGGGIKADYSKGVFSVTVTLPAAN